MAYKKNDIGEMLHKNNEKLHVIIWALSAWIFAPIGIFALRPKSDAQMASAQEGATFLGTAFSWFCPIRVCQILLLSSASSSFSSGTCWHWHFCWRSFDCAIPSTTSFYSCGRPNGRRSCHHFPMLRWSGGAGKNILISVTGLPIFPWFKFE
jgi:hypothetical protein